MMFGKKPQDGFAGQNVPPAAQGKAQEERRSPSPGPALGATRATTDESRAAAPPAAAKSSHREEKSSILGPHLSFEGNLKFSGRVTIDCEIFGSVTTEDTLIIGPLGRIEGDVCAGTLEVAGKVHGDIKVKSKVRLQTGCEVCGDIETPTISMAEGVAFEGKCMRPQADSAAFHASAPSAPVAAGLPPAANRPGLRRTATPLPSEIPAVTANVTA
jgi:cytoskeletal protein CcmA (bactofilin family)